MIVLLPSPPPAYRGEPAYLAGARRDDLGKSLMALAVVRRLNVAGGLSGDCVEIVRATDAACAPAAEQPSPLA
ncbi:MAG TPA: hypothetical protein VJ890_24470 [Vineibacter sp.]|nr:hypothetical protein [Vineibacter sp.]